MEVRWPWRKHSTRRIAPHMEFWMDSGWSREERCPGPVTGIMPKHSPQRYHPNLFPSHPATSGSAATPTPSTEGERSERPLHAMPRRESAFAVLQRPSPAPPRDQRERSNTHALHRRRAKQASAACNAPKRICVRSSPTSFVCPTPRPAGAQQHPRPPPKASEASVCCMQCFSEGDLRLQPPVPSPSHPATSGSAATPTSSTEGERSERPLHAML